MLLHNVLVRPAVPSDHPTFAKLFPELGVDDAIPDATRFSNEMLESTIFAEDERKSVLGYAYYVVLKDTVHLSQIVVAKEARRCGVGTVLMGAVRDRARVNDDVVVDLDVDGNVNGDGPPLTTDCPQPSSSQGRGIHVLSFQRLDVYQRAIEFLSLVGDIVGGLPKGHGDRADQLVRAAESVLRNIAEGAGRWLEADCSKHYEIARGSAMECAASLDVMRIRRVIAPEHYDRGIRLLEAVVAMLTKML